MNAQDLIDRARKLGPALRERLAEGDALRKLPDATLQDMHAAGFFRMLQPARWGGHEVDPQTFFEVQWTLAAACPSTAWVLGVVGVHAWQLALFPLEAQQEVWGEDSATLISSSYAPTGKVEVVDGGYRISGRWSFSSGSDHCKWVFLGGFVPTAPGERPDMRTFLLPRSDYRIEDTWYTMGLKATGSKDIVVEGAFVPEHRTHRLIDGYKRSSPGNAVNPAPLFKLPFGQVFVRSVSTSAIGIAQGALDAYCEAAAKRVAAGDGAKVAEDPTAQIAAAAAEAAIDESKAVLLRNFDEMMKAVRDGGELSVERRIKFRYDSGRVAQRCMEAVDGLFTASGGRAIFNGAQIQRYFLDAHTARAHYANNPDKPGRNFGGVQLKLKNSDFFL